jgi:uncharacterized protein
VITETCRLFLARYGAAAPVRLLTNYTEGQFDIFSLDVDHARRMQVLMKRYADLPMDLADASLVILAEHLGHGRILSTDQRDFHTYRWKDRRPFENLLMGG